mmetsp:Transcript_25080/g.62086  ORF Transcript_25080/g.62086 Transcript_25080/m.62086 type:complete len:93 (+) Transcript_25080:719-997(+)
MATQTYTHGSTHTGRQATMPEIAHTHTYIRTHPTQEQQTRLGLARVATMDGTHKQGAPTMAASGEGRGAGGNGWMEGFNGIHHQFSRGTSTF